MDRPKKYRHRRPKKVEEKPAEETLMPAKKKPEMCDKAVQAYSIMVLIPFNLLKNVPVEVMRKHSALYNREMLKAEDPVTAKHLLPIAPAPTRRDALAAAAPATSNTVTAATKATKVTKVTKVTNVTPVQEIDIDIIIKLIQKLTDEKRVYLREHLDILDSSDVRPTYVIDSDSDVEIITEAYISSEKNRKTISDRLKAMKIDKGAQSVKRDPEEMETESASDASENKRKTKEATEAQLSHLPPKLRCKNAIAEGSSSSSECSSADEATVKSEISPAFSLLTAHNVSPRSCLSSPPVSRAGSCAGSSRAPVSPAGSCAGSPRAPISPAGSCAGSPVPLAGSCAGPLRSPVSPARSCVGSPRATVSPVGTCTSSARASASPSGEQPAHPQRLFDESTSVSTMGSKPTMFEDKQRSQPARQQSPQLRSPPPPPPPMPSYTFCTGAAGKPLSAPTGCRIPRSKLLEFRRTSVPAFRPPADILQNYPSSCVPVYQSPNSSFPKPPLAQKLPASPPSTYLQTTDDHSSTSPQADNLYLRKSPSNDPPMGPGLAHQAPTKTMLLKYLRTSYPPPTSTVTTYSQANQPSSVTSFGVNVPDKHSFAFTHPEREEGFQYPTTQAHNVHQRQSSRYNLRRASVDCNPDVFQNDLFAPSGSQMMTDKQSVVNRIFNPNVPRETQHEPQRPMSCTPVPPPIHFPYYQNIRAANKGPRKIGPPRKMGPPSAPYANMGPPSMRHMIPQHNMYGGHALQPPPPPPTPPPQTPYYMPRDT